MSKTSPFYLYKLNPSRSSSGQIDGHGRDYFSKQLRHRRCIAPITRFLDARLIRRVAAANMGVPDGLRVSKLGLIRQSRISAESLNIVPASFAKSNSGQDDRALRLSLMAKLLQRV